MNDTFLLNEFGTLTHWNDVTCLYPYTKTEDSFRGGAFWCIPNQGPMYDVFEKQNGEYRKIVAEHNSTTKHLSGKWGELNTGVDWNTKDNTLVSTMKLVALRDGTFVRPGFHPYFSVSGNYTITIGAKTISKETLAENKITTILIQTSTKAVLEQENATTEISFTVNSTLKTKEVSLSFAVWSDNKENYVCIEPVVGGEEYFDGSLSPITLEQGEGLTIEAKMVVTPHQLP